jgi:hypothetical protein
MTATIDRSDKPMLRYQHGEILPMQADDAIFWGGRSQALSMQEWCKQRHNRAPWWRRLFTRAASSDPVPPASDALPTTAHTVEAGAGANLPDSAFDDLFDPDADWTGQ